MQRSESEHSDSQEKILSQTNTALLHYTVNTLIENTEIYSPRKQ